ncbi:MAG: hypothetical protein NTW49_07650 [Bacteroidia bacterium]|nr:hypothetical protein [Bacteroidia bacterium]
MMLPERLLSDAECYTILQISDIETYTRYFICSGDKPGTKNLMDIMTMKLSMSTLIEPGNLFARISLLVTEFDFS